MTKIKILILSEGLVYKQNDKYFSRDTFLHFIRYLKKYFDSIAICAPVLYRNGQAESLYEVPLDESGSIKIQETFPHKTVIEFYKKLPIIIFRNFPICHKAVKNTDIVFLRLPAMNAFLITILAWIYNKQVVCYIVGDEKSIVEAGSRYKGMWLKFALSISNFHTFLYKKIIHFSKVSFFLSTSLKKKYGEIQGISFLMFTSLITNNSIQKRNNYYRLNIPVKILYVGRLSHEKGIEYLIQAMKSLIKENLSLKLLICGDGPEREKLQNLVQRMGLNDYIDFLGFVIWGDELSNIYLSCDIFILPSLSEGFPKVILEAMAKGLPIISTNVGGIPDVIQNMENGILVAPKNPEAISEAVKLIINNNSLRKKIVENGYRLTKDHTAEKQAWKIAKSIYQHAS